MTNWILDRIYNTVWDTKKELFQFFKVKRWSGKQDNSLKRPKIINPYFIIDL